MGEELLRRTQLHARVGEFDCGHEGWIPRKRRFVYVWEIMTAVQSVKASKATLDNMMMVAAATVDDDMTRTFLMWAFAKTEDNHSATFVSDYDPEAAESASFAEADAADKAADSHVNEEDVQSDWGTVTSDDSASDFANSGSEFSPSKNAPTMHALLAAATSQPLWLASSPVTGPDGVRRTVGELRVISWDNVAYGDLMSVSLHGVSAQDTATERLLILALIYDLFGASNALQGDSSRASNAAQPRQHRVNAKKVKSLIQSLLRIPPCLSKTAGQAKQSLGVLLLRSCHRGCPIKHESLCFPQLGQSLPCGNLPPKLFWQSTPSTSRRSRRRGCPRGTWCPLPSGKRFWPPMREWTTSTTRGCRKLFPLWLNGPTKRQGNNCHPLPAP